MASISSPINFLKPTGTAAPNLRSQAILAWFSRAGSPGDVKPIGDEGVSTSQMLRIAVSLSSGLRFVLGHAQNRLGHIFKDHIDVVQGETFNPMLLPAPWGIVEIVANMIMGHPDRKLLHPWQGTENLIDRAIDIVLKAFEQE